MLILSHLVLPMLILGCLAHSDIFLANIDHSRLPMPILGPMLILGLPGSFWEIFSHFRLFRTPPCSF